MGYAEQISASERPTPNVKTETRTQPQTTAMEPPASIASPQSYFFKKKKRDE
jgi:hypothetical protein